MATFAIKTILVLGLVLYMGGPVKTAWRVMNADELQETPAIPDETEEVGEAIPLCDEITRVHCDATRTIVPVTWPDHQAWSVQEDGPRPEPRVLRKPPRVGVSGALDCPSLTSGLTPASGGRDLEDMQVRKVSCTRLQRIAAEFFLTYRGSTE